MKAIVIAAGYATRLGELTKNFPKPLLQIGRSTILDRMLDDIDTIPEIDEVVVVTNHKFAPIFEEWAARRLGRDAGSPVCETVAARGRVNGRGPQATAQREGCSEAEVSQAGLPESTAKPISIVDDGTETNETRLGAVCDLLLAIGKLGIDDDLLVVAADNILDFSFREFVDFAYAKGTSCIMCHEQPSIEKLQRTGVIVVDDNMKVLDMEEKPQVPKSHWAVPPFYIYLKKDLPLVRRSVQDGCGKDAPGNLAHYMVEHTVMHAWPMSAGRFDIGSLDTYYEAVEKYGCNIFTGKR